MREGPRRIIEFFNALVHLTLYPFAKSRWNRVIVTLFRHIYGLVFQIVEYDKAVDVSDGFAQSVNQRERVLTSQ